MRALDGIVRLRPMLPKWAGMVALCAWLAAALLAVPPAGGETFDRRPTPPPAARTPQGERLSVPPLGDRSAGDSGGWVSRQFADRLAYRADRPHPSPRGQGLVDRNLQASRTWFIQDLLHGNKTITTIVEKDRLCLDEYFYEPIWSYAGDLYQDYWYFYSSQSLVCLGLAVGAAAVLANSSLDEDFRTWFQDNVATDPDDWRYAKLSGETWVVASVLLGTWAIDEWAPPYGIFRERLWTPELGDWSRQSLRALLVGVPVIGVLQYATGASRPGESEHGSDWRPFEDHNGVSGHTFIGAVPFLVAAKRADGFLLKSAYFVGSGLAGYSRINDDAHYLSQVILGWSIAYLSVEATQLTERSHLQYRLVPLTIDGLLGVGVELRY